MARSEHDLVPQTCQAGRAPGKISSYTLGNELSNAAPSPRPFQGIWGGGQICKLEAGGEPVVSSQEQNCVLWESGECS